MEQQAKLEQVKKQLKDALDPAKDTDTADKVNFALIDLPVFGEKASENDLEFRWPKQQEDLDGLTAVPVLA